MSEWDGFALEAYDFAAFPRGSRVLDIGFGRGLQMRALAARGCRPFGIELDARRFDGIRGSDLKVVRASAEALPFASGSFGGIVCKVVVPYTDEALALREVARVLQPGGTARISYHAAGYYLRYVVSGPGWRRRLYGLRALVNGWWYAITGRRLPGFMGDTLYQSRRRLRGYYRDLGLQATRTDSPRFLGCDVFIYDDVRRPGAMSAESARNTATAAGATARPG